MRRRCLPGLGVFGIVALAACANDFDTSRPTPVRGTLGEEMYGVLCDRTGAQSLHEDLTGASFRAVCHRQADGTFRDTVDRALLPTESADAVDTNGNSVTIDQQKATREAAVARVEALARRRADLIAALDATFPDTTLNVKDVTSSDPTQTCTTMPTQGRLHDELSLLLGRLQDLYNDGTLPQATESFAKVMQAFAKSPEALVALAKLDARQGYRPVPVSFGAAHPLLAYPGLRDFSNVALGLLSADSQPYDPNAKRDASGHRIPVPGSANARFNKLLEVLHQELLTAKPEALQGALTSARDPANGREVLSRPRDNLEFSQRLLLAQDPAFGGGDPSYVVRRDMRGYALVARPTGAVPAPFVDANGDGLADVNDLGQFVTTDGTPAPTPFLSLTAPDKAARDALGRAVLGQAPAYEYLDTRHTFAASLVGDLRSFVNSDPAAKQETLMYVLGAAPVLFGTRDGSPTSTRAYDGGGSVSYDAFHPKDAAILDLFHAFSQILSDRNADDVLALTSQLFTSHVPDIARIVGNSLAIREMAKAHDEAKLAPDAVFWDDMLDVFVKIAKEPGLLEDILAALGDDKSLALGTIYSTYMKSSDHVSYDPQHFDGPPKNLTTGDTSGPTKPVDRSKPDTGWNQSTLQRFLRTIHDANGVTACNKDNAVVHVKGLAIDIDLPLLGGTYKECEVYKLENLAKFYLQSIVGKSSIYFRPDVMRNGILSYGAATVGVIEQSSGIGVGNGLTGFWESSVDAKTFHPRPGWLHRQLFYDVDGDSSNPVTQSYLKDIQGAHGIGSRACPERIIDDPVPNAPDASSDKKVHGLRSCGPGQSTFERDRDALFVWEQIGFFDAMTPLLTAFTSRDKEDLFLDLTEVLHKHWGDDKTSQAEGDFGGGQSCSKAGLVSYEQLFGELLVTDLIPALHDLIGTLKKLQITRCKAVDPATHQCSGQETVSGISVLANATRGLLDPDLAHARGLKDRAGNVTAKRNDGTTNPQVTPIYLLTDALDAMDQAFDGFAKIHPEDQGRLAQWRTARSQLVDRFLTVTGSGASANFRNAAIPAVVPIAVDTLRAQLLAHCPTSFSPPYDACTWMQNDLVQKASDSIAGPAFASTVDLVDVLRKDDAARTQLENLAAYFFDPGSANDALLNLLASLTDTLQVLRDDENLVPLLHVLAEATAASKQNPDGSSEKSFVDAQTSLLARIAGKAPGAGGAEACERELDPNQILLLAVSNLVKPMPRADGQPGLMPIQVIMDVIGDVNRIAPQKTDKLVAADYGNIASNVVDFLLNKERGLEQFYEIVRQGTTSGTSH